LRVKKIQFLIVLEYLFVILNRIVTSAFNMEPKLNALIIDDEENARMLLYKLLEETLFFSEIRTAQSVNLAHNELVRFDPDIIFLDIKMPGKDGFAFIHDMLPKKNKPGIVFVTAYDQYAIKAIKNQAFDYLLKPVNRKELKNCIVKFIDSRREDKALVNPGKTFDQFEKITRIRVNTRTGTIFINPATILFCKADGNYTTICTGEKQHLCSMNLGKIEEMLPGKSFIRVGRSYIINFEFITMLDRKESTVTLVRNGESISVKIPRHHLKDIDIM
jgi:two-component system, LytTR family, response regulator